MRDVGTSHPGLQLPLSRPAKSVDAALTASTVIRLFAFLACLLAAANGQAQVAGQASLASDSVFRGVSLSNGRPVPSLSVGADFEPRWFLGSLLSTARIAPSGTSSGEVVAYGGFTERLGATTTAELGATGTAFPGASDYNYGEFFVGISQPDLNGRIYVSPNYFSQSVRTVYIELNGAHTLAPHLNLLGHLGSLAGVSGTSDAGTRATDVRIGLGLDVDRLNLQINWSDVSRIAYLYPAASTSARRRWTLSAAIAF